MTDEDDDDDDRVTAGEKKDNVTFLFWVDRSGSGGGVKNFIREREREEGRKEGISSILCWNYSVS